MSRIASFDVFDTVLTRAVGSPQDVFYLLGQRLLVESAVLATPAAFASARLEAENRAYRNAGGDDSGVTLRHIYDELAYFLGLEDSVRDRIQNLELDLEARLIRAVPEAAERVRAARRRGDKVVYVSDMYLSSDFIRRQLSCHGLWENGDRLFVSCEHEASKRSGALFEILVRELQVAPTYVTHCGNERRGDVESASRFGIEADLFPVANANRYERILGSYSSTTDGLSAVMAGASRLARLSVPARSPEEKVQRDVTAGVVAPVLTAYTMWILQDARERGLERLYFVSRDGQILLDLARKLAPSLRIDCELRYLYGSRKAWNLGAVRDASEAQTYWVWDQTDHMSVRSLLERVSLDAGEVREVLQETGIPEAEWSRNLTPRERRKLRHALRGDSRFNELLTERAAEHRSLLLRYFAQEGLLADVPCGMVDVGWMGSMYYTLADILSAEGSGMPVGYFFALTRNPHRDAHELPLPQTFLFNQYLNRGLQGFPPGRPEWGEDLPPHRPLVVMLEVFCNADHGTVTGFRDGNGSVSPILLQQDNEVALGWGLPLVRRTVESFAEHLCLDPDLVNPKADLRVAILDVLAAFWRQPSAGEARTWGAFRFEDGMGAGSRWNALAKPFRWTAVWPSFRSGALEKSHRLTWLEGSMALTSRPVKLALASALRLRRSLKTVSRLSRWTPRLP